MITSIELRNLVPSWGLEEHVIEKDYCLGWALKGIASHPELREQWVFKGGTCLKKCYIETYRFSEDLDFTVLDLKYIDVEILKGIFKQITSTIESESGIRFTTRDPVFRQRENNPLSVEGKLYYIGPRGAPRESSIKLDLSAQEKLVDEPVYNSISHPYSDSELVSSVKIKTYSFNELFAEKIRAMGERCRPRDLYDIINLHRRDDFDKKPEIIYDLLKKKCTVKSIPVITLDSIINSVFKEELISEWKNMLGHQLPVLPSFDSFWKELPFLFKWLEGIAKPVLLPGISQAGGEQPIEAIRSFTSAPEKFYGFSMEAVRFAAVNRLYIKMGYKNDYRLVAPYSLRTSKDGNILLYAVGENDGPKAFRIDRIQSVEVTNKEFTPVYRIEFPAAGRVPAPRIHRERGISTGFSGSRTKNHYGPEYVYECSVCGKRFRRKKMNSKLNKHKDEYGNTCYGTYGMLVDTVY